jgi:hypothetical protein
VVVSVGVGDGYKRGVLVASLFSECNGAIMGTDTEFGMREGEEELLGVDVRNGKLVSLKTCREM